MSEAHHISQLLAPELQAEIDITRRILTAVPDGHNDFKPHDKSMTLARLAGHVAELPSFATVTLSSPNFDLAAPNTRKRHVFETSAQNVAAFESLATDATATVNATSDTQFNEPWSLVWGEHVIFKGHPLQRLPSHGDESHHPPPRSTRRLPPSPRHTRPQDLRPLRRRAIDQRIGCLLSVPHSSQPRRDEWDPPTNHPRSSNENR